MDMLKLCNKCRKNDEETFHGYIGWVDNSCYECPICGDKMIDTIITIDEYNIIDDVSDDISFLEAMIKLKEDNIIEYQSRMSQFKSQVNQQTKKQESSNNVVKCPRCKSTNIQIVPRKWSLLTGFMTNKTDRVCVNCKHKF